MMTTIKVLLAVFAIVVLVLVGGVIWFLRIVRRAVKEAANSPAGPPCRVNPEPEPNPQWRSPALVNQYADELRALGFVDAGSFQLPELGGLLMAGFVHSGERLVATVYDHRTIDPTFDICCDFEDETGVSATNSSAGDTLDKRPGHPILWLGKISVREVFDAIQKHPQPSSRKPIFRDGFPAQFKKSYAEGMNWRLKKGGASREEIRRQAEKKEHNLDKDALEEVIESTYHSQRASYVVELQAGCIAQYLDEQKPSAADWERLRPRVFAIPETLELKEVIEAISNAAKLDEEQRHQLDKVEKAFGETALNVMENILRQNIGTLGLQKLGEVKEPVGALIFLSPETPRVAPSAKTV